MTKTQELGEVVPISDDDMRDLQALLDACPAPPWQAIVEGRDQPLGGDSFVQVSDGSEVYVNAGSFEGNTRVIDLLAMARNLLPDLLDEIREARSRS